MLSDSGLFQDRGDVEIKKEGEKRLEKSPTIAVSSYFQVGSAVIGSSASLRLDFIGYAADRRFGVPNVENPQTSWTFVFS